MTSISSILVGNFALTAAFVAYYLSRTFWGQVKSGPVTWQDSKPMRLVLAMALFVTGCFLFIVAASVAPTIAVISVSTYIVWGAWLTLWLAEITALTAIGRVSPAIAVCGLWTLYTIATRFAV